MGLFDSLTDAFTGAPAAKAAEQQRQFLANTQAVGSGQIIGARDSATGYLDAGKTGATGAINTGTTGAMGSIDAGRAGSLTALGEAYGTGNDALQAGYNQAGNALTGGGNAANGYYDKAAGAYDPLAALGQKYGAGTDLYLNSLGINGAGGNAAAVNAFQAGPGYQFSLDQGLNSIDRARNAAGMLSGGNTDRDAQNYGFGLANQEYGNWQNRLAGLINPELSATSGAASGRAGVLGQQAGATNETARAQAALAGERGKMLADLAQQYGTARAGINTGAATQRAGLESGQGGSLADLAYKTGTGQAGLQTGAAGQQVGLATGLAQPYSNTYGQEAAAQQQGSGNLWNLLLGGAKVAAGAAGGAGGLPSAPGVSGSVPKSGNFNLPVF